MYQVRSGVSRLSRVSATRMQIKALAGLCLLSRVYNQGDLRSWGLFEFRVTRKRKFGKPLRQNWYSVVLVVAIWRRISLHLRFRDAV